MIQQDYREFKEKIEAYKKIILVSHSAPDYDAAGSQLGLYLSLKSSYPNKVLLAAGECIAEEFQHHYTELKASDYQGALVIITDSGAAKLVSDQNFVKADSTICIDHHNSREVYTDISILDTTSISTCLMIYEIIDALALKIDAEIANLLLIGIVADSGRFKYKNTDKDTFRIASELMDLGADMHYANSRINRQSLAFVRHKGYVMNNFMIYEDRIAYIKHSKELVQQSQLSQFEVTRGMVNTMADIDGIDVWCNFTETEDGIKAEFRSKAIPVVSVAKNHGGGGHELACGATLGSFDEVDACLQELLALL